MWTHEYGTIRQRETTYKDTKEEIKVLLLRTQFINFLEFFASTSTV